MAQSTRWHRRRRPSGGQRNFTQPTNLRISRRQRQGADAGRDELVLEHQRANRHGLGTGRTESRFVVVAPFG